MTPGRFKDGRCQGTGRVNGTEEAGEAARCSGFYSSSKASGFKTSLNCLAAVPVNLNVRRE